MWGRDGIVMAERMPLLRIGPDVIVSFHGDLHDRVAIQLQEDLLAETSRRKTRGIVLDISGLDIVDSFVGRLFGELSSMARLMGTRTVLVGMRAEIAMTLVELGVELEGIETALNLERGLAALAKLDDGP